MEEKEIYGECMRNHAASLGTYATDGCGEYTPEPSTAGGFQCAACGCHRNFHRKVPTLCGGDGRAVSCSPPSAPAEDRSSEGRRRTRTRLSVAQKERMLEFAEKIGWRMPKKDDGDELARFCREIGVGRQVFKVWMHNHKSTGSWRSSSTSTAAANVTTTGANASSLTQ